MSNSGRAFILAIDTGGMRRIYRGAINGTPTGRDPGRFEVCTVAGMKCQLERQVVLWTLLPTWRSFLSEGSTSRDASVSPGRHRLRGHGRLER